MCHVLAGLHGLIALALASSSLVAVDADLSARVERLQSPRSATKEDADAASWKETHQRIHIILDGIQNVTQRELAQKYFDNNYAMYAPRATTTPLVPSIRTGTGTSSVRATSTHTATRTITYTPTMTATGTATGTTTTTVTTITPTRTLTTSLLPAVTTSATRTSATGTSTTRTLSSTSSLTSTTITTTAYCMEEDVFWEPLDMQGFFATPEATSAACQQRCLATPGCYHFSYYKATQSCHMQDAFALRRGSGGGFVSGPFQCWAYLTNQESYAKVSAVNYLPAALRCMEVGTSWLPAVGTAKILPTAAQDNLGGLGLILSCQNKCQETPGCAYFTLQLATSECHMSNAAATPMRGMLDTIGGPPHCEDRIFVQRSTLAKLVFGRSALAANSMLLMLSVSICFALGALGLWHRRCCTRGKLVGQKALKLGLVGLGAPRVPFCPESERELGAFFDGHTYQNVDVIDVSL